jgi:hypothetical protein
LILNSDRLAAIDAIGQEPEVTGIAKPVIDRKSLNSDTADFCLARRELVLPC